MAVTFVVIVLASLSVTARGQVQADSWHLAFRMSGGFAGVSRELTLSSTGAAAAIDRGGRTAMSTISGDRLRTIASLVATAQASDPRPSGCADCFGYDLDVRWSARQLSIHEDDATLPRSNAAALINELRTLLDRLLSASTPQRQP